MNEWVNETNNNPPMPSLLPYFFYYRVQKQNHTHFPLISTSSFRWVSTNTAFYFYLCRPNLFIITGDYDSIQFDLSWLGSFAMLNFNLLNFSLTNAKSIFICPLFEFASLSLDLSLSFSNWQTTIHFNLNLDLLVQFQKLKITMDDLLPIFTCAILQCSNASIYHCHIILQNLYKKWTNFHWNYNHYHHHHHQI